MKKFKLLIPMMVFVMAIGMAFASKTNLETGLWVERDGQPYQLKSNPCTSVTLTKCRVVFADDLNSIEHQVFIDEGLTNPKLNGSMTPYEIIE